jgi:beta-glucosidase
MNTADRALPESLMPAVQRADFPPDFRWGCATSSYQIEGGADQDGRGESIWDRFCRQPGAIADGSSGAVACDHYHLWREDFNLARAMGLNAYRFSVSWPRIFPEGRGAAPNPRGLDFYSRLVDGMLQRGLEPFATLYHWDLPQALQEEGGWTNRETVHAYLDYADALARHLGDRVPNWITHNEPWCAAFLGHHEGAHAPGMRSWPAALQVCHHLLLSHGLAVPVLRASSPAARVGISLSLHPLRAASASPADLDAVRRHDGFRNRWFLDPLFGRGYPADAWALAGASAPAVLEGDLEAIAAPIDFLGVNYYFPETIADAPGTPPIATRVSIPEGVERTGFGWPVSPGGMVDLLGRIAREYRPSEIQITENGSCYEDAPDAQGDVEDTERRRYLARHLVAARECLALGIPVKGYFAWSLIDNFEWAEGYRRRFGLAHVDFPTQRRRLKASGRWYRDFLAGK